MNIVALDIGGTTIKSGMYVNHKLVNIKENDTDAKSGGHHVIRKAIEILKTYQGFGGIGISTAGQVDSVQGKIIYANSNIPDYTGMAVKEILEKEFLVPVFVENDVNAAAIGEAAFGAGQEDKDFLCLTYGTGIGGAIIMDGKIHSGSSFSAGEFGALITHGENRNPEEDIFSGCYERYASTTALVKLAMNADNTLDNGRKIFARLEEPFVKQIVDKWIQEIVFGLASLIHIFNPSCVLLGGGVMEQEYVAKKVREVVQKHIMSSFCNVTIKNTELGNKAGLLGVVKLVQEGLKK